MGNLARPVVPVVPVSARRRARKETDGLPPPPPVPEHAALRTELEATRARLQRAEQARDEAHHRIANSLSLAAVFLKTERQGLADEAAGRALLAAEARLHGIAQLHRWLCDHDEDDPVLLGSFLGELADGLRAALGLDCAVACEEVAVPGPVAMQIALVVAELALNALKHAYDGRDGGRVAIEGRREGGRLRLAVSDGGDGLPEAFDAGRSEGLGMTVVDAAVRQMGGRLSARTDGGAVFVLEIPLDGIPLAEIPLDGAGGQPRDRPNGPSSRSYSASGTP